jgi:hypothetical protein
VNGGEWVSGPTPRFTNSPVLGPRVHDLMPTPPPLPPEAAPPDITGLLLSWAQGESTAADRLMQTVYDDLHRQAARAMHSEGDAHTLQATALVNEAYLRLVDQRRVAWRNRAHFFAIASTVMRAPSARTSRGGRGEIERRQPPKPGPDCWPPLSSGRGCRMRGVWP